MCDRKFALIVAIALLPTDLLLFASGNCRAGTNQQPIMLRRQCDGRARSMSSNVEKDYFFSSMSRTCVAVLPTFCPMCVSALCQTA
jgi:hypothetical protein